MDVPTEVENANMQPEFMARFNKRLRRSRIAAVARSAGVQSAWSLTLLAGAGVPLAQALGAYKWVAPILGFLVVVASGAQGIFARTAGMGSAMDRLARSLASERRLYEMSAGPYAEQGDMFIRFVERSEEAIAGYDRAMVKANRKHSSRAG